MAVVHLLPCAAILLFVGTHFWPLAAMMVCRAISIGAMANVCFFKLVLSIAPEQVDSTIGMMEAFGNGISFLLPLAFSTFWPGLSFVAGVVVIALYVLQPSKKQC